MKILTIVHYWSLNPLIRFNQDPRPAWLMVKIFVQLCYRHCATLRTALLHTALVRSSCLLDADAHSFRLISIAFRSSFYTSQSQSSCQSEIEKLISVRKWLKSKYFKIVLRLPFQRGLNAGWSKCSQQPAASSQAARLREISVKMV